MSEELKLNQIAEYEAILLTLQSADSNTKTKAVRDSLLELLKTHNKLGDWRAYCLKKSLVRDLHKNIIQVAHRTITALKSQIELDREIHEKDVLCNVRSRLLSKRRKLASAYREKYREDYIAEVTNSKYSGNELWDMLECHIESGEVGPWNIEEYI